MKKKKRFKKVIIGLVVLVLAFFIALHLYTKDYYHILEDAESQLVSDKEINVESKKDYYKVSKVNSHNKIGLIFYPGAKVETSAYIALARSLAKQDIDVYLMNMPYHLAIFKSNAAIDVIDANEDINEWYLSGHSLGGAVVSGNIKNDKVVGLILLGAYPIDKKLPIKPMLAIKGSEDNVLTMDNYNTNLKPYKSKLEELTIEGGNHAFYAEYGAQKGDGKASISNKEQIRITSEAIIKFINEHSK